MGATPEEAAFLGASQVALPELVSTICTLLVLWPLALTSELGDVPVQADGAGRHVLHDRRLPAVADPGAGLLRRLAAGPSRPRRPRRTGTAKDGPREPETFEIERPPAPRPGFLRRAWAGWQSGIDAFFGGYVRILDWMLRHRVAVVATAVVLLAGALVADLPDPAPGLLPRGRLRRLRDDVRAPSGTRIEVHRGAGSPRSRHFLRRMIEPKDLELFITEIGVTPDWSAAYTPNAGPMDAVVRVQLTRRARAGRPRSTSPGSATG